MKIVLSRKMHLKATLLIMVSLLFIYSGCSSSKKKITRPDDEEYSGFQSEGIAGSGNISEKESKKKAEKKQETEDLFVEDDAELDESSSAEDFVNTEDVLTQESPSEEITEESASEEDTASVEASEENIKVEENLIDPSSSEDEILDEEALAEEERRKAYDNGWQPVKETKYERALRKQKEKEAKEKAKAEEKKKKKQKKDPYTGWVYVPKKNFKVEKGDIQLVLRGKSGTFGIYAVPESGRKRPLLATQDDYSSTYFMLKAGRQEYQLNRESGISCESRETDYGAQLAYSIKKKFQFVVDFSLMPSISTSSRIDVIRVTLYTTNLSKNTQSFTVKGIFDTMLGENTTQHFSTAARSRINSEVQFTDLSLDRWIRSSNNKASIQFLLDGKGITKPKSVSLANKDILSAPANWELSTKDQRSFSSVLAYNNSALGINWKTAYLDPLKTDVITFYISVATDDREPAGREFLNNLERGKTALPSAMPETALLSNIATEPETVAPEETATEYYDNMPVISGDPYVINSLTEGDENLIIPAESPATGSDSFAVPQDESIYLQEPVSVNPYSQPVPEYISEPPVEYVPQTIPNQTEILLPSQQYIPKKQYDPEYIQDLLDRIAELENDPALVDKTEIERLNKELDSILSDLRSFE